MPDPSVPKPEILIDSDWKSQAQAERDRLAEAEAKAPPKGAGPGAPGDLPPADFASLVGMLATQSLMYLGGVADRKTGQAIFDPEMARFYIDLLAVVEEKTKGNITAEESAELAGALHELRARFVELARAVAAQGARGAGPAPGVGAAAGAGAPKIRLD